MIFWYAPSLLSWRTQYVLVTVCGGNSTYAKFWIFIVSQRRAPASGTRVYNQNTTVHQSVEEDSAQKKIGTRPVPTLIQKGC